VSDAALPVTTLEPSEEPGSAFEVFRNGPFLRLWLSQAATQIGGNMVLFGLTVIVVDSTNSKTAVGLLILSFLVPAVAFSAVAGVYVDQFDRSSSRPTSCAVRRSSACTWAARTSCSSCCSTRSSRP
jgi:MFS family permease